MTLVPLMQFTVVFAIVVPVTVIPVVFLMAISVATPVSIVIVLVVISARECASRYQTQHQDRARKIQQFLRQYRFSCFEIEVLA